VPQQAPPSATPPGAQPANGAAPSRTPEYLSYKRAVESGNVSFHQVASAWFDWHWGPDDCQNCKGTGWLTAQAPPAANGGATALATRCPTCRGRGSYHENPQLADAYEEIFQELLEVFGAQRGGVITAYFCENIRVAAALTDIYSASERADGPIMSVGELETERKRLAGRSRLRRWADWIGGHFGEKASSTAIHIEPTFGDPDSPRAKQILFRCLKVHYQALEYLKPKPRKICMRMTFNVITMLLGTLDNRIGRGEKASAFDQSHADQRTLEEELASTEAYYLNAARRTSRMHYMLGMVVGLPLAGAVAYLLFTIDDLPTNMAIIFAAGSVGALVSVMERLTAGKLEMNHEVGRATNVSLGLIRPFVGALFALALYFFISGELVSVFNLPEDDVQPYFFAGIGFLAGFSERFAQDIVAQSKTAAGGAAAAPSRTQAAAR
jgi:hypothetical protein